MASTVLMEDIWKNWEKTGKTDFFKSCKQLLKDENRSPLFTKSGKTTLFSSYIYNLILHGIQGPLKKEAVVSTLAELVGMHYDVCGLICDALNILDAETSSCENQSDERSNFCFIVKEAEKFLSDKLLKERLEIDTLQEVGILKNKNFYTKFIKVKTKLYYKQRKFNLFREESEGYSKLIVELNQESSDNDSDILEVIKSLIGCFNLDPNRVLDIILESFENRPDRDGYFIPLIQSYMNDPKIICEVLGSKFSFYQTNLENITPKSLYTVTALLLQYSIISLDDIYCWLLPDDKTMQKEIEKEMKDAKEYCRKLQIISIKDKDKEETPEEKENVHEKYILNQKFGLCEALLSISDWNNALLVIKKLPDHMAVEQEPIALEICKMLHAIVEPVYRRECILAPKISNKPVSPLKSKMAPKQAQTFLELRDIAIPMLVILGPSLRYDPVLMYKIIRLSKAALTSSGADVLKAAPPGDSLYNDILTILDSTILPSLSYMDCNCCVAEEVWNVLKLYPYQCRYCLYSRWKNDTYQQHPKLMVKRGDAQKQIKNIMKRVSKETIKPVGRLIGKLTHCSPGFLFDYVLLQIQIYDNLIHPVVDSLKYLTSLSYDVLGFCLVESLTQADRNRFKHDGTSISLWLQSLASFCGAIFKKYNIELSGLLQYVGNQLKAQKSLDLLILKEIVQKMAGIEAAEELTDEQLDAMAGGDLLKGEAGYFSQVRNTKKSSLRLKEAMAEQNLAVALCLLIAQQKYCVVYRETENSHLKLVGKLYDQCQDTLVQFGTFLGSTLSVDEYVTKLPSIQSMLQDYHIHADVAFFLARPMFNHAINMKYDQLRKLDPNCKKLSTSAKQQKYYEAVKEVMAPIVESVTPLHSIKVWEDISPQFLVTFWSLTMYDLYVPTDSYQREINKIKQLSLTAMDSKDVTASKGKKEQERYQTLMEKLQDEKKKQHEHVEKVLYRLKQEKDTWFLSRSVKSAKNETITQFLQLCLFPRCVFTAVDSAYCAKFVHTIHMLKTANFATLLCYDRLFCDITYSVTSCTENEANRYGRFLCAMLETVMRWHSDKSIYDQECANYPGFVTKYRVSNQFSENCDHVGYENYRHVCHKWHYKITKAMIICLDSKDYVQIRNALIILIKIIPHFPVLNKLAQIIEKRVEKVRDEEKNLRQDLYTLAISYAGQLKLRAGHMIKEVDFHQIPDKPKNHENLSDGDGDVNAKTVNGEQKEKDKPLPETLKELSVKDSKERTEKKSNRQQTESTYSKQIKQTPQSPNHKEMSNKDRSDKEKTPIYKDIETKEKHIKKEKDDKREESEKERDRDREKRKERKDEKTILKEERQYREDRYVEMSLTKEETRYVSDRTPSDRYYSGADRGNHYYEEREVISSSNSSNLRRSQEPAEPDRDVKRRKVEGPSSKSSKHEDRKLHQIDQYVLEKPEKKERSSKTKEKRDKGTEEEKELRKERKLGRKRDRGDEALLQEQKRRRDEEKVKMMSHTNGELVDSLVHSRDKHHHNRDKSPYVRERSHDRAELRDKHRRSSEGKRR